MLLRLRKREFARCRRCSWQCVSPTTCTSDAHHHLGVHTHRSFANPAACRSLYVSVITTIRGYGDYLWVDVVERVDAMGSQVGWAGQD